MDGADARPLDGLDPDLRRAILWSPAPLRPALAALFALDGELARVVLTTTDPMIGRIRLAWWRERLQALDDGAPPPAPVLAALAADVVPRVSGERLAAFEDGALDWLDGDLASAARARGGAVFAAAADLLGGGDPGNAGAAWAGGALRRLGLAVERVAPPRRLARHLRPLLALARTGVRPADERADAPARQIAFAWTMLVG